MAYRYKTEGVCSVYIDLEMDGNVVKEVEFHGGCNGNLQGISSLVKGMTYEEIKDRLDGIRCGFKQTSCPDQLVRAIEEAMVNN
ncbi:MAG: TIGR03905 family TSCPD domain-containing protein [Clostridia bacterium]|nr:TIGR03905 family TSCPD domain-containing protein [Clostridia bacterium]MDO5303482.1 TIGR03905 family TSCPD domain-containing protein [Clostridia bacterium]